MEDYLQTSLPLIGDMAPEFQAVTTQGMIHFPGDYKGKWIILFSHPGDFTPVCTTEFMTFASMINEFKELNTELIGISIDSLYSHIAWLRKIREFAWKDIKHVNVTFPLVADITMEISKKYGMLHPANSGTQTVRAVFLIDTEGKIRAILYYPASTGRNMQEIKRMIIALQKTDAENIATPANWKPGEDVIIPPPGTCAGAAQRAEQVTENMYCLDWFLCFEQSNMHSENSAIQYDDIPYSSMYSPRNRYNYRR